MIVNPQKIAVLTDSCADIDPRLAEQMEIFILPLKIIYPEREYQDGVDIVASEVYRRMPEQIPTTSLPDGQTVLDMLERIRQMGYEKLIAICLSAGLSGTYNMVRLAAQNFQGLECAVFDSNSGSLGEGCIALQAAHYIRQGMGWQELQRRVAGLVRDTHVMFSLDTLEYLQKGGRIGKITCLAGTMLQIKPIISFAEDGQLASISKVRGRRRSIDEMVQRVKAMVPTDGRPYVMATAHGDAPEDQAYLKARDPAGDRRGGPLLRRGHRLHAGRPHRPAPDRRGHPAAGALSTKQNKKGRTSRPAFFARHGRKAQWKTDKRAHPALPAAQPPSG